MVHLFNQTFIFHLSWLPNLKWKYGTQYNSHFEYNSHTGEISLFEEHFPWKKSSRDTKKTQVKKIYYRDAICIHEYVQSSPFLLILINKWQNDFNRLTTLITYINTDFVREKKDPL